MFIAHIGVGLAAKRAAPRAPLGALLLAGQTLDVICGLLMVAGVERMRVSPGITRMTPLEFISYPWSHGLLMSAAWSLLAALLAWRLWRDRRAAAAVGLLVLSHWVLDFVSHRPDLPLLFMLNHFSPPPPATIPRQLLALPILVFVLLLPWGNWIDRHRMPRFPA